VTRQWSVGDRSDNADDITVAQKFATVEAARAFGVGAPTIWRLSYVGPIRFGKETLKSRPTSDLV
jgi:hypothetical protein